MHLASNLAIGGVARLAGQQLLRRLHRWVASVGSSRVLVLDAFEGKRVKICVEELHTY